MEPIGGFYHKDTMALQKQLVSLNFSKGLDTRTDPFQVGDERLIVLENGVFTTPGKLSKRNGHTTLSNLIEGTNAAHTRGLGLATYEWDQQELLMFDGYNMFSYLNQQERWSNRGKYSHITAESRSVHQNSYNQINPEVVSYNNIAVYVWEDSRGGLRYSAIDLATNTNIVADTQLVADGYNPQARVFANVFLICYTTSGGSLCYKTISYTSPTSLSSATTLVSDLDTTYPVYDVCVVGSRCFFAYNRNSNDTNVFYMDTSFTTGTQVQYAMVADGGICLVGDEVQNVWIFISDRTSAIKCAVRNYNNTSVLSLTTIESYGGTQKHIAATVVDDVATVWYEFLDNSNASDGYVKSTTATLTGTVATPSVFMRSVGLASKGWTCDGYSFVTLTHESTYQSTYFVADTNANVLARLSSLQGGGLVSAEVLPSVSSLGDNTYLLPTGRKGRFLATNTEWYTLIGVHQNKLTINATNPSTAVIGNGLVLAGACPKYYDGSHLVEQGFHLYPENITLTDGYNQPDGYMDAGVYQYVVMYSWIDSKNNLHRSSPSPIQTITLADGYNTVTLTVPTLRITEKEDVFIQIFRTENAGTSFYEVTDPFAPLRNDKTVNSLTFRDTLNDVDLIGAPLAYTSGATDEELAAIPAPSCRIVATHQNRLWIAGLENPYQLWYSKNQQNRVAAEFSDYQFINIDPSGGPITGMVSMDDKLIVFKRNAVYYISGVGPDNTGASGTFEANVATKDVGAILTDNAVFAPVAVYTNGTVFKSATGIYQLNRGMYVEYIGAPVQGFNDNTLTSMIVVPETHTIRCGHSDGNVLVYDYINNLWSSFTNQRQVDAVIWNNTYAFLRSDGRVAVEDPTSHLDDGLDIKMALETGWRSFGDLQGFKRVWRLLLLGKRYGTHSLRVRAAYDYKDVWVQEALLDVDEVTGAGTYGSIGPYGTSDTSVYGNGNFGTGYQLYQFRFDFAQTAVQSIRLRIEDVQNGNYNEAFDISALTYEIGVIPGLGVVADANKAGVT